MSDNLIAFLRTWLDWAEAGAPDSERHTERNPSRFTRECGLCANTHEFEEVILEVNTFETGKLERELSEAFEEDGLTPGYPFGGFDNYEDDAESGTHYLNSARLAWVRGKLASVNVAST